MTRDGYEGRIAELNTMNSQPPPTPLKFSPSLSRTMGWWSPLRSTDAAPRSMVHVANAVALDVVPLLIAMAAHIMRVVPAVHRGLDDVGARVRFYRRQICRADCRRGKRQSRQEKDSRRAH